MAPLIALFTDFGAADLYVGQVKAQFHALAPGIPLVDVLHDAPEFNPRAAAHLLAALAGAFPAGTVFFAVVDPGVGGHRTPLAVQADGKWYVGPDNGLLSVVAARAREVAWHQIAWRPERLSHSFHGRDLFAPVAARLATGNLPSAWLTTPVRPAFTIEAGDLAEIIHVDHYGNALTGLRSGSVARELQLLVAGQEISFARVFSEVPVGSVFWHENSVGLVEIAVNCGNAAQRLNLVPGSRVNILSSTNRKP